MIYPAATSLSPEDFWPQPQRRLRDVIRGRATLPATQYGSPTNKCIISYDDYRVAGSAAIIDDTIIFIDHRSPYAGTHQQWLQHLHATPLKLRRPCRSLVIYNHVGETARMQHKLRQSLRSNTIAGIAWAPNGTVNLWGPMIQQPFNIACLLEHELAHLHADDGGSPLEMRASWYEAQIADANHCQ